MESNQTREWLGYQGGARSFILQGRSLTEAGLKLAMQGRTEDLELSILHSTLECCDGRHGPHATQALRPVVSHRALCIWGLGSSKHTKYSVIQPQTDL